MKTVKLAEGDPVTLSGKAATVVHVSSDGQVWVTLNADPPQRYGKNRHPLATKRGRNLATHQAPRGGEEEAVKTVKLTRTQKLVAEEVQKAPGEYNSIAVACTNLKYRLGQRGCYRLDQRTLDKLFALGVVEVRKGKMYPPLAEKDKVTP